MAKYENILVICVDRDNDLGRKTGIKGPVVGRKANLNAAAKLALADPEEADANSMFAAIKKFDELSAIEGMKNVEVCTLTGVGKTGFESDKKIMEQIESVLEAFPADGVVFVSDGSEDEQVIPMIQGRVPIISVEVVIIKQAKEVESTYYSIMEALRDPGIARIVFLVPGLVILLWGSLFFLGFERLFVQSMSILIGAYLILKGTGLEEKIASTVSSVTKSVSLQKISFPFYITSILFFFIGIYASMNAFTQPGQQNVVLQFSAAAEQLTNFVAVAGAAFLLGRSIDAIQLKKAFYLRRYSLSIVTIFLAWFILDSGRRVLIGESYAGIDYFVINVLISFAVAFIAYKASSVLDVRKKVTRLLVGLPVYDKQGRWIGKVEDVEKQTRTITYKNIKTKETINVAIPKFYLREGKIYLS